MSTGTKTRTLADLWHDHADRTLSITVSQAQVMRAKRDWYHEQLLRLKAIPNRTAEQESQFQEALGFARTIGTAVEAAEFNVPPAGRSAPWCPHGVSNQNRCLRCD